jgi:hypothetical protein
LLIVPILQLNMSCLQIYKIQIILMEFKACIGRKIKEE